MKYSNKETYLVAEHIKRDDYLSTELSRGTSEDAEEIITFYCRSKGCSDALKLDLALNALDKVVWSEVIASVK